jgi:hypothetical protein
LVDRGRLDAELARDLAAVHDERFLEQVLHLAEFPHGGVDQSDRAQHQRWHGAKFGTGLPSALVDDVDELPGGAGVGVVREVPHLAGGVGVFAEDGEGFTDVGM